MKEIWKDIKGYEGLYQISSLGNVKSLNYHRERREKLLNQELDIHGYYKITLWKNNVYKKYSIHKLVAEAFIPNPNNCQYINHKNEIKTDNKIENLEWCTAKYNVNYSKRKLCKPILQYDLDDNFIKEWESAMEIERSLGFNNSQINKCCKGFYEKAHGYKWNFK